MTALLIDPHAFGSADHVTTLTFTRRARFGGFVALLATEAIFLAAVAWKGQQPRLVLQRGDEGYDDWRGLLEATPPLSERHRFVGAAEAAADPIGQWLTHGPSALLS